MERGLLAPLSPHEEVTLRRIALGISKAKHLPARDVAHLLRLCLVVENDGHLTITNIERQRYRALSKGPGMMPVETKDEAARGRALHFSRAPAVARNSKPKHGVTRQQVSPCLV